MKYKTLDLFAGIGGIGLGFKNTGYFESVYANDNDKFACDVYDFNSLEGGIKIDRRSIWDVLEQKKLPRFDVLLAGFPCQAFSIAGRKKGFHDDRGTLFFAIARILEEYKPKAFLLENVKNLEKHDKKKTFAQIKGILENDLGYCVYSKVLNSSNFGVPQNRERIYIVGFKKNVDFIFPEGEPFKGGVGKILERNVESKYYLSKVYFEGLKNHRKRHESKGHGFGYQVLDKTQNAFALVCGGMGRERNLVRDKGPREPYIFSCGRKRALNKEGIRKLTPKECSKLQGFPPNFKLYPTATQAYKQLSNSVTVPVIEAIAHEMYKSLSKGRKKKK